MAYIGKGLDNGVRNQFVFAATQGQTSFSGSDSDGKTLAMTDILYTDCYQNGVKLKPTTDYTVTSTTLTLVSAASVNDVINIVSFDTFAVPDTVSASTGGTFVGQVTFTADTTFADGADIVTASAGTSNFRAGVNAGNSIQSGGNYNVTVGDEAGTALSTGDNNVAIGYAAFDSATDQQDNVAIGYNALTAITASGGTLCTAVGSKALEANTAGYHNTAVGYGAQDANTHGIRNVSMGRDSLGADTKGSYNTAIGDLALTTQNFTSATNSYNTAVGASAGASVTTGSLNTLIGAVCGDALTTGGQNTAVGQNSLTSATTSGNNTAIGYLALLATTTGGQNTAVGAQALDANTTAANNTAVGYNTLSANTTGDTNSAFGKDALKVCTTGTNNCAIGTRSLQALTTAASNVAVGDLAGGGVTTGANNTFLGTNAGDNVTTGTDNILIGLNPSTSQVDSQRQIVMGRNVVGAGGDHLTFGDGSTDSAIQFGATSITAPSDVRYKEDIADATAGLAFIKDLRPVTFKWKKEKDLPTSHRAYVEGSESRTINDYTNHGFIAQEVKAVIDAHSEIKDGFDMWSTDEQADGGRQRLGEASLMPIMVKAVQELSTKLDAALARIETLEG